MWAAVLVPPVLRARTVQRSGDSIGDFSHRLSALARRTGRRQQSNDVRGRIDSLARLQAATVSGAPAVQTRHPSGMTPMQRRRRDVLLSLAGASTLTFLLGLISGAGVVWFAWFVVTAAAGAYVWLLLRMKSENEERKHKVRYLDERRSNQAPAPVPYALSRSAGS